MATAATAAEAMAVVFWILSAGVFLWVAPTYVAPKSAGHEIEAVVLLVAAVLATSGWVVTAIERVRPRASWPASERADHPASCERADPEPPKRTERFVPLAIASIVLLVAAATVSVFLLEPRR
jgi:hypothetical protein